MSYSHGKILFFKFDISALIIIYARNVARILKPYETEQNYNAAE